MHGTMKDLELDFFSASRPSGAAHHLLQSAAFPPFQNSIMEADKGPGDLAREDPLATQVWKFFSKVKRNLPNQERMENLTWRMMAMSMRKRQQQEEASRCDAPTSTLFPQCLFALVSHYGFFPPFLGRKELGRAEGPLRACPFTPGQRVLTLGS